MKQTEIMCLKHFLESIFHLCSDTIKSTRISACSFVCSFVCFKVHTYFMVFSHLFVTILIFQRYQNESHQLSRFYSAESTLQRIKPQHDGQTENLHKNTTFIQSGTQRDAISINFSADAFLMNSFFSHFHIISSTQCDV